MKHAITYCDGHVIDAGFSSAHQAVFIKLPLFVDEAHRDTIACIRPNLFDEAILLFALPFARQVGLNGGPAGKELRSIPFVHGGQDLRISYVPKYITNSADAAIGHALLGGGVTMVLVYQVAEAVRAGKLKVILADFEPSPLPISVVYPTTRLLSAKVRAFVDLIAKTCDWQFVKL